MSSTHTYTLSTANFSSGTLYWKVEGTGSVPAITSDFTTTIGTVSVSNNSGTFDIEVEYNPGIEKNKTFKILLYSDSDRTDLVHQSSVIKLIEPVIDSTISAETITATNTGSTTTASVSFNLDGTVVATEESVDRNLTSWYTPSGSDTPGNIYEVKIDAVTVNSNHTLEIYGSSTWSTYTFGSWVSLQSNKQFRIQDSTGTGIFNTSTFLVNIRDSNSQTNRGSSTYTFTMTNGSYPICEELGDMWRTGGTSLRNDLISDIQFNALEDDTRVSFYQSNGTTTNGTSQRYLNNITTANHNDPKKDVTDYVNWCTIIYRNYGIPGDNAQLTTYYVSDDLTSDATHLGYLKVNGVQQATTDIPTQDIAKFSRVGYTHVNAKYRQIDSLDLRLYYGSLSGYYERGFFILPGRYQITDYRSGLNVPTVTVSGVSRNDIIIAFAMDESGSITTANTQISLGGSFHEIMTRASHTNSGTKGYSATHMYICDIASGETTFEISRNVATSQDPCVQVLHLKCAGLDGDVTGSSNDGSSITYDITGSSSLTEPVAGTIYSLENSPLDFNIPESVEQDLNSRDFLKIYFDPQINTSGGSVVSIRNNGVSNLDLSRAVSSSQGFYTSPSEGFFAYIDNSDIANQYFMVDMSSATSSGNYTADFNYWYNLFGGEVPNLNAVSSAFGDVTIVDEYSYTISTSGVSAGTVLYWRCNNSDGTAADTANFAEGFDKGSVTIDAAGQGTIKIRLTQNSSSSTNEEFIISLYSSNTYTTEVFSGSNSTVGTITITNVNSSSSTVQIQGSSSSPSGNEFYSGHFVETSILESGSAAETKANFVVSASGVGNGTTVGYTITGVSVNDISLSSLTGSITIYSNVGALSFTAVADSTTEGNETLTLTLDSTDSNGASVGSVSDSVVITDNSTTPSSPSPGTPTVPSAPNGGDLGNVNAN